MTFRSLILDNFAWKLISLMLALLVWWRVNSLLDTDLAQPANPVVDPEMTQTLILSLPVRVLSPARIPGGFAVVPSEVTVTLLGKAAALEQVNTTNVVAYVDATLAPSVKTATLTVMVRPPSGVTVRTISPPELYVERL